MNHNESPLQLIAAFSMVSADREPLSCTITGRPVPPSLSPEVVELMRQHFWCDFSDVIPLMAWDEGVEN